MNHPTPIFDTSLRDASVATAFDTERFRHEIDSSMRGQFERMVQRGPMAHDPLVRQLYRWASHYLESGGHRMHGICVWLSYAAFGGDDEEAICKVAAAVQLYHHHTMVHDDVYDEDAARRRWPTTHVAFADWFAAQGRDNRVPTRLFRSDAARRGVVTAFAYGKIIRALGLYGIGTAGFDAARTMAISSLLNWHELFDNAGQMKDVDLEGRQVPSSGTCLSNAWLKTGRLFEICARIGAILAGAGEREQDAVACWAGNVGLAYQIRDDLEDIAEASEKGQGRGIGVDMLYCKPTYLYALTRELATPTDREILRAWEQARRKEEGIAQIVDIIKRSGAHSLVEHKVQELLEEGQVALRAVGNSIAPGFEDAMRAFARYFVSADYWNRALEHGVPKLQQLFAPDQASADAPGYPATPCDSRRHG